MSSESYKHAGDIFTTLHLVTAPGEIIDGSILIEEHMKSKTQYYIDAVTEYLARPRKVWDMSTRLYPEEADDEFRLEGHRFAVVEADFSNVMTFTKTRMISIRPADFTDIEALSITYERAFWGRKVDMESRIQACTKLAGNFVRNMLPKVDYRFKVQMHNDEINNILEVLE